MQVDSSVECLCDRARLAARQSKRGRRHSAQRQGVDVAQSRAAAGEEWCGDVPRKRVAGGSQLCVTPVGERRIQIERHHSARSAARQPRSRGHPGDRACTGEGLSRGERHR